jgi:hypothetical protein
VGVGVPVAVACEGVGVALGGAAGVPAMRPQAARHSVERTAITNRRFDKTLPIIPSSKRVREAVCYEGTRQAARRSTMRALATESAI